MKIKLIILLSYFISSILFAIEINTEQLFLDQLKVHRQSSTPKKLFNITVNNTKQLLKAIRQANKQHNTAIYLTSGHYQVKQTIQITANNIALIAIDKNPFNTIISGQGMRKTLGVDNLIRVSGSYFYLNGLTLENAGNHLIQIAGEKRANYPVIQNSILQNGYEQLLKVTYNLKKPDNYSIQGRVENCLFRYTAGIGPNYYIGGIDAHGIQNWIIKNNIFENIASPAKHIAEHAIHIWNNSKNNKVINNTIINSDRGIGFGMRNKQHVNLKYGNLAGEITNNIIYHENNKHPYADVGIILEDSIDTIITKNIIVLEHSYNAAIEYRFPMTSNILIANNVVNKAIKQRNNAQALIIENTISSKAAINTLSNHLTNYIRFSKD